ncbi:MAG TPA: lysophospholipid acyltransferase family protein [Anaerolineales bacterium]|nr:lysophospholipid acyltransferase family protein [Anaerolineales bacterium]
MPTSTAAPSKPRADSLRPELTRLPELTPRRLANRARIARICAALIRNLTRATFSGISNFPAAGPGIIALNHLGDADVAMIATALPVQPEALAKVELYDFPFVGWLVNTYGVIWVHRGTADRRALRAALDGLADGRFIAIAPEGRQSITGSLEEGTGGAAYLALKADVPVIPLALTGTQDSNVYGNWRRFRKPALTLTIGEPFRLEEVGSPSETLHAGADAIMRRIAALLPESYRGVYVD